MNDYSKLMKDKDSFATGYTCTDDKIFATFASLGKNKPIVYNLNQENYDLFEKRIKEQYQATIAARDKIIQKGYIIPEITLVLLGVVSLALGVSATIVYPEMIGLTGALISVGPLSFVAAFIVDKKSIKKAQNIDLCAEYLEIREKLERAYVDDTNKNITRHVSQQTNDVIVSQDELRENLKNIGINAQVFSIGTMDKLTDLGKLKDIRNMLLVIKAMEGLKKSVELDSTYTNGAHSKQGNISCDLVDEEYIETKHHHIKKRHQ